MMQYSQWNGFRGGEWQRAIDVRSFIQKNYTLYEGDDSFLVPPTDRTRRVWEKCEKLILEELKKGILDVDTDRISGIDNFEPGYIDKENEVIVGLQTDAPLKRIVNLYGGMRMAKSSLEQYGYQLDPTIERHFAEYRKTHNEGVFDAYPERTRVARHVGLLTGLPDAYGRGRIIGDYRRVALYGIDRLIEEKKNDLKAIDGPMDEERIRLREEVSEQIRALGKVKAMAARYGGDEFICLCVNTEKEEIESYLKRVYEDLRLAHIEHATSPAASLATVSIGYSLFDNDEGFDLETAITMADTALYQAKNSGRNRHSCCL